MLAAINMEYGTADVIKKMSPEQYEVLRTRMPQMKLPEDQTKYDHWGSPHDLLVDDSDMVFLTTLQLKYTISRIKGVNMPDPRNPDHLHQQIYQISVANIGLMQVTAVIVEEDCCTDKLQDMLDDGWRILAVCPPNDVRRPTYVLGHTDRSKNR